jgi:putative hydrolase of the HAD superfamily
MKYITAIGFDLFNTLITVDAPALDKALYRLMRSLLKSGFALDKTAFNRAYREAALRFVEEARQDGRETHNRFWISAALQSQGYHVPPDDARIASGVDAYFSAFFEHCHLIPGTAEMLGTLKAPYRLGLLSNFTHGPAARKIIDLVGLTSFFDVVLISGELGYRKPHPLVFHRLIECFDVKGRQILYVGDDPEPDILGAERAGIQPVWFTYVLDHNIAPAPGIRSSNVQDPDSEVPRISTWQEFLVLLDRQRVDA